MIIFDEKTYAERLLNGKARWVAISQRDLNILGRYFKWLNMNATDIQYHLVEYCKKVDPTFNEVVMGDRIEYAVKSGMTYPLRISEPIQISRGEMAAIRSLNTIKLQKLLFVLLAISKHFSRNDNGFYFMGTDTDLFRLARLGSMRKQERIEAIFNLNSQNYIQTNMLGAYKLLIAEGLDFPPADVQVIIYNIEKAMEYFPWQCSVCGNEVLGKPKRRDICDNCYLLKRRGDIRKNVRKARKISQNI